MPFLRDKRIDFQLKKVLNPPLVNGKKRIIYQEMTMKTRVVSALMAVAVASITASAVTVDKKIPSVKAIRAIASETSVVELPAKAAEIVAQASEETREKVAIRTVRIFLQNHHSLAPSLVGAIANTTPEVAPAVVAEAISLFPESAYSITKAAVAAAPKHAIQIALRAAAANRAHAAKISAGVERAIPAHAQDYRNVLTAISTGERVESADLAIVTVKVRIGSSSSITPADLNNPSLNTGAGQTQQVFTGVQQSIVTNPDGSVEIVFTIDTGNEEIPENFQGQEQSGFDIITRDLLRGDNRFVRDITIESYIN